MVVFEAVGLAQAFLKEIWSSCMAYIVKPLAQSQCAPQVRANANMSINAYISKQNATLTLLTQAKALPSC